MVTLLPIKLADEQLERVRRNTHDAVSELQRLPSSTARILRNIALLDGIATPIAHGLGRRAFVVHSPPRGAMSAGYIEEVRDGSSKPETYVVLKANGYGATITIDIEVK